MVKGKVWRWAGLAAGLLFLIGGFIWFYQVFFKVEPGPLLEETLQRAQQAESYRYRLVAELDLGGKKRNWVRVDGERAPGCYHFRGETLGTPVEIYQIGKRSYTRDPVTGKWTVIDGIDLSQQQLYMAEIDPLSSFQFKSGAVPTLAGKDKVRGRKCWVLEVKPEVESKYLELWWEDFTYRFWIDRRSHVLLKAEAKARSKNSRDTKLTMVVEFRDFNEKIKFEPPV